MLMVITMIMIMMIVVAIWYWCWWLHGKDYNNWKDKDDKNDVVITKNNETNNHGYNNNDYIEIIKNKDTW